MAKDAQKYAGCWYCDNIIDHPEQVGLLHLGFPRCFVLIPNSGDFYLRVSSLLTGQLAGSFRQRNT